MPSYIYNMVDTWNAGATTFTAIKMNVTDTASAAASLLMDLQVGGASRFRVTKAGEAVFASNSFVGDTGGSLGRMSFNTSMPYVVLGGSGTGYFGLANTNVQVADVILSRRAAANLRFGAADAAAPVAQTLSVQSVVAGTTNTAGANLTITGSQGTGTGAGGSIVFQVAPAGSPGTVQNALDTALTIASNKSVTFAGLVSGITYLAIQPTGYTNGLLLYDTGSGPSFALTSNGDIRWSSSSTNAGSTADVLLARDAANTLALRNGAAAQAFNLYGTYTSSTSYERLAFTYTASNDYVIRVEKGSAAGSNRSLTVETYGNATSTFESETLKLKNDGRFAWSSSSASRGSVDTAIHRIDAGIVGIRGSSSSTGAALSLIEQTAPAAPAANGVRIYAEDDGAGKTRLMARFATGAAVQIAIEP
jgi:hypothetical protein